MYTNSGPEQKRFLWAGGIDVAGISLEGDLGEMVSLSYCTPPFFLQRE